MQYTEEIRQRHRQILEGAKSSAGANPGCFYSVYHCFPKSWRLWAEKVPLLNYQIHVHTVYTSTHQTSMHLPPLGERQGVSSNSEPAASSAVCV